MEHDSDEDDGDDANLRHHCKAWRITVVMLILTTRGTSTVVDAKHQ